MWIKVKNMLIDSSYIYSIVQIDRGIHVECFDEICFGFDFETDKEAKIEFDKISERLQYP